MNDVTPKDLARRYKAAYVAVNGRSVIVTYRNGWFTVGHTLSQSKYRRSDIMKMLYNLECRAVMAASGEEK